MLQLYRSLAVAGALAATLTGSTGQRRTPVGPTAPFLTVTQRSAAASSTTTWTVSGCTFTVTYTWEGFKGRDLIASYGLYERLGQFDGSFNLQNDPGQVGKGGTVTHTFTLTANAKPGRYILARGSLVNGKTYAQISGSSSGTSSIYSTCG